MDPKKNWVSIIHLTVSHAKALHFHIALCGRSSISLEIIYIYIYTYMYLEIRVALALVLQYNYTQLLVVLFLVLRSASHLYNVYLHRRPCSLSAFSGFGPRRVTKYQLTFYFGVSCIWAIYNDLGPVHPKWRFSAGNPPQNGLKSWIPALLHLKSVRWQISSPTWRTASSRRRG